MAHLPDKDAPFSGHVPWNYEDHFKRAFDVLACLAAAPVLIPLIGLIAFIVSLNGGSPFYSQKRLGRNGVRFDCWKIRSMVPDADQVLDAYLRECPHAAAEWRSKQKLDDDPRVTRFGAFLRKTSLDELPQFLNVLRGEMSLVGPRPMTPQQRHLYSGGAYFLMRPGLTGFWQVSDRSSGSFASRIDHDERYYREVSLITDLTLLFKTVGAVARGTGV